MVMWRAGKRVLPVMSALALGVLAAAAGGRPASAAQASAPAAPLAAAFSAASQRYQVPEDLLLTVSYLETGWNAAFQSNENGVPVYGPMALYQTAKGKGTLDQAASDLGVTPAELETDPSLNIMGGAAVLADDAHATHGSAPTSINQWYGAVADYVGVTDYQPAKQFADAVYGALAAGASGTASDGEQLSVPPQKVKPDKSEIDVLNLTHLQPQQSDYPAADEFIPAGGTGRQGSNRPKNGLFIGYVVLHDTEEDYPGTVRSFSDPGECCSAHYVVDGEASGGYPAVTQFVFNHDIAYHAGNYWFNQHSIGIEHVGFADNPAGYFTQKMYDSSAKLVAYLAAVYGIPIDRAHLIEHGNVPAPFQSLTNYMHWDNGPFWDWPYYLGQIKADYEQWTNGAPLPAPTVPAQDQQARQQIRVINVNSQFAAASDIPTWSAGGHADFAGVTTTPGGNELVLGASDPATWTSPSSYNARDFSCDNLPDATQNSQGTWTEDGNSDLRAKADWGDAFALIGQATAGGTVYDEINWNGTTGWIPDADTTAGWGVIVTFTGGSQPTTLYGQPTLSSGNAICPDSQYGFSRAGQAYVAQNEYTDPATGITWYQIFYNHRLAWVPASEVTAS